jgi:molecular chaperone GrpE
VLDDLERALGSAGEADSGWVKGVELTKKNLESVLERHGAKEIVALGLGFDPSAHEAVMELPGVEGTVVAVVKRGWKLHDKVIRPAMVGVGNGS